MPQACYMRGTSLDDLDEFLTFLQPVTSAQTSMEQILHCCICGVSTPGDTPMSLLSAAAVLNINPACRHAQLVTDLRSLLVRNLKGRHTFYGITGDTLVLSGQQQPQAVHVFEPSCRAWSFLVATPAPTRHSAPTSSERSSTPRTKSCDLG